MRDTAGSVERLGGQGTGRRWLPRMLLIGISSLLFACVLGLLLISAPVLPLPCMSRFASDPFNGPTYYVTYRLDGDLSHSQTYLVEVGRSLPSAQGGFTSNAMVALRIPLVSSSHC